MPRWRSRANTSTTEGDKNSKDSILRSRMREHSNSTLWAGLIVYPVVNFSKRRIELSG